MKITDVETIELRVGWRNSVVPVHTDAGVTGIAEVDSVPSVIGLSSMRPARTPMRWALGKR